MAWALPAGAVLGIFCKKPEAGLVKTRLATEFGAHAAAEMHEAMLLDLIETWNSREVLGPGGRRVVAYAPADAGSWFDGRVPDSFTLRPQVEGDLGLRMQEFFEAEFESGATRVVLIGSDAPTLDPTIVISAFLCLEGRDVVLGPATDGGYYLVGSRYAPPPIFEGIDWSTCEVLGRTIATLQGTSLSLALLPPWYDVDTPADWRTLAGHIFAMRRAGMDPRLPRIETLLRRAECLGVPSGGTPMADG